MEVTIDCDDSYPDECIESPPPDLNCDDIPEKNFKVTGSDPHGFDADNDGIGCEGNPPTTHRLLIVIPHIQIFVYRRHRLTWIAMRSQRRTLKSQDLTHMDLTQITMA